MQRDDPFLARAVPPARNFETPSHNLQWVLVERPGEAPFPHEATLGHAPAESEVEPEQLITLDDPRLFVRVLTEGETEKAVKDLHVTNRHVEKLDKGESVTSCPRPGHTEA